MNIKPYQKHQLYLNDYEVIDGVARLPDECNWIVLEHKGEICLILNETRSETSGFWSVMSFLTLDEAKELAKQLAYAISGLPR